jgi:hypothetical protein
MTEFKNTLILFTGGQINWWVDLSNKKFSFNFILFLFWQLCFYKKYADIILKIVNKQIYEKKYLMR